MTFWFRSYASSLRAEGDLLRKSLTLLPVLATASTTMGVPEGLAYRNSGLAAAFGQKAGETFLVAHRLLGREFWYLSFTGEDGEVSLEAACLCSTCVVSAGSVVHVEGLPLPA